MSDSAINKVWFNAKQRYEHMNFGNLVLSDVHKTCNF